jgi:uncharacterized membrane protein (DUF485 family)
MQNVLDRVTANPKFHEFIAMRSRYSIIMAIVSAAAYYGFILLVAFNKEFLATKLESRHASPVSAFHSASASLPSPSC